MTQRTAEIGVRVAIGASRPALLRMVVFDGLRLVIAGMLVGMVGFMSDVRSIEHMLYGVSAFDATTMLASAATLVMVALVASLVPALRRLRRSGQGHVRRLTAAERSHTCAGLMPPVRLHSSRCVRWPLPFAARSRLPRRPPLRRLATMRLLTSG